MDLGFQTIGNATTILYDGGPQLATDTWVLGSAYFGSWTHQHVIPEEQMEAIKACPYWWISHGHPDHLSFESLQALGRDKKILLPDHYGGRIVDGLKGEGFDVTVMKCGEWVEISPRMRIMSLADYNQDAALLIDLDGRLIADVNDASNHGGAPFLAKTAAQYDESYLLALCGYGDADMINFFDEDGNRVLPYAANKEPIGPGIAGLLHMLGIKHYVPFSTQHRYQRTDSAWTNEYITPSEEMLHGFESDHADILPVYVHCDFNTGEVRGLNPDPTSHEVFEPEVFGDNWTDQLEPADVAKIEAYLRPIEHFQRFLGFVRFVVGGKEHVFDFAPEHRDRGVTFETPRASLMQSVEWKVFDDLMIGNFTKTTMHGDWGGREGADAMYPDLNPFWTKYYDNGGAATDGELRAYFADYRRRGFTDYNLRPDVAASLAPYV